MKTASVYYNNQYLFISMGDRPTYEVGPGNPNRRRRR
ncbi:MAG: hypothetical protein KatS3mg022_3589 [Armatimonadota bacterium]|nr:MAG: hypothetical protein KatS3mg022_3589 [Armatimonadota bacterium]